MKTLSKYKAKLLVGSVLSVLGLWAVGVFGAPTSSAADPCNRKTFATKMVESACKAGGQDEAKKQMKVFLKQIQQKKEDFTCLNCHTDLAPAYPLKADGLKLFKEHGGN